VTKLDVFGLVATCITTYSFWPQVWQTWKTKDVKAINLSAYALLTLGLGMWLAYGIMIVNIPLIVGNAIMVCLTAAIMTMKVVFGRHDQKINTTPLPRD
jgi:MtN3 and saliva related transmembrane protein